MISIIVYSEERQQSASQMRENKNAITMFGIKTRENARRRERERDVSARNRFKILYIPPLCEHVRKNSTHPSWRSVTDRLIASHTYRGGKHLRGRLPLAEMLARDGVRRGIRDNVPKRAPWCWGAGEGGGASPVPLFMVALLKAA